ncbi:MAG: methyltransferase domain-containing protein [Thermodesulfobacteriota bacterium]|jgi:ubiquinone/menaquinone biosynthesis C-methylase UbiE/predicted amino acid-binding ACT domain protein
MNDQLKKSNPPTLTFTGERFMPEVHGNIELEHLHRYLQACEIATGKVVLDIACGEGYGSSMLANWAVKVIGVDISVESVKHARKRYKKENLEYMVGSCTDIPLPDASVDIVVSFETIEHHDQHMQMMKEVKRILRPTGILLISSPDKYHYSVKPGYMNPYHIKELYQHEFKQLLGTYFKNIAYFGQRVIYGSGLFAESLQTQALSYFQENEIVRKASGIIKPTYWIALASDVQLPNLASSVFEQPINDSEIIQSWSKAVAERDEQIVNLNQAVNKSDDQIAGLNQALAEHDEQIVNLNQAVNESDDQIAGLNQALAEHDAQIVNLNQALIERNSHIVNLIQALNECDVQIHEYKNIASRQDERIRALDQILHKRELALNSLTAELGRIISSRSWKVTKPLRFAGRILRGDWAAVRASIHSRRNAK